MTNVRMRCLDDHGRGTCRGEVLPRERPRDGSAYPRCEGHWEVRRAEYARIDRDYPDSPNPPEWFDPTYAGEVWDDSDEDIPWM